MELSGKLEDEKEQAYENLLFSLSVLTHESQGEKPNRQYFDHSKKAIVRMKDPVSQPPRRINDCAVACLSIREEENPSSVQISSNTKRYRFHLTLKDNLLCHL